MPARSFSTNDANFVPLRPEGTLVVFYKSNRDIDTRPPPSKCALPGAEYACIEDLPTELLREIFFLYVTLRERPFFLGSTYEGPLALAHVCSRWRAISFSMPDLWAAFSFPVGATTLMKPSRRLKPVNRPTNPSDFFVECLQRSASLPLIVDVCHQEYPSGLPLLVPDAQKLLFDQAGRWKVLMMSLHGSFATEFLTLDASATPQLEQLVLDGHMKSKDPLGSPVDVHAFAHKVQSLPSVKRLWFGGCKEMSHRDLEGLRCLPLERLECLTLAFPMRMVDAYHILQRCVSAKSVTLSSIEDNSNDDLKDMPPIRLPLLEHLVLGAYHVTGDIFRAMDAPNLSHLSVHDTHPFYQGHVGEWESAVRGFDEGFNLRKMIAEASSAKAPIRAKLSFHCEFDSRRATRRTPK
ncbi:hypothetical protein BKA70DRAFT_1253918 [Coprinopsis sp. MPI-PUGE-AT-0042]|nr:hypothetical protein BKA70DRAFT_1253918 [Coprinopsis sp. MPI-PUGE-AT-0042]